MPYTHRRNTCVWDHNRTKIHANPTSDSCLQARLALERRMYPTRRTLTLNAVDSVCLNSVLGTDEKFVYVVEASLDTAGLQAVAAAACNPTVENDGEDSGATGPFSMERSRRLLLQLLFQNVPRRVVF